jgi:hypothetical protein
MQGVYVSNQRPKYKKDLKTAVDENPASVSIEATSWFGNEYDGLLINAPLGDYYIVGPNPHNKRNWYATITVSNTGKLPLLPDYEHERYYTVK